MKTLQAQQNTVANVLYDAAKTRADSSRASNPLLNTESNTGETDPLVARLQDRNIQDTVSLSSGGQKIVNLNNARDLAQDIKDAPIDENFAETLRKATNDTWRITTLFTESVKSLFNWFAK